MPFLTEIPLIGLTHGQSHKTDNYTKLINFIAFFAKMPGLGKSL